MRISIRLGTSNSNMPEDSQPTLFVYRERGRKDVLATARQTKSGRWIVYFGYNQWPDVAEDRSAAETMLYQFFEKLGNH